MAIPDYVRWFSDIRLDDVALVGGKNASLGELYSTLSKQGVRVPNGFALTAEAYRDALTAAKAWERLHQLLDNLDKRNVDVLAKRATEAREIVYRATATGPLREQIDRAYRQLETEYKTSVAVAVRSSATAEDLPSASFAGQHESFLNVSGTDELFEACRRCFASICWRCRFWGELGSRRSAVMRWRCWRRPRRWCRAEESQGACAPFPLWRSRMCSMVWVSGAACSLP